MRHLAIFLPLLLALACKSNPGDEAGESSGSSTGDCGPADPAAVDPNYPPCDCDYKCESAGAVCHFTDMSSICEPQCTNGASCKNAVDPCTDSDCPSFAGLTPTCDSGRCILYCDADRPCPTGYVCIENLRCQAEL